VCGRVNSRAHKHSHTRVGWVAPVIACVQASFRLGYGIDTLIWRAVTAITVLHSALGGYEQSVMFLCPSFHTLVYTLAFQPILC